MEVEGSCHHGVNKMADKEGVQHSMSDSDCARCIWWCLVVYCIVYMLLVFFSFFLFFS